MAKADGAIADVLGKECSDHSDTYALGERLSSADDVIKLRACATNSLLGGVHASISKLSGSSDRISARISDPSKSGRISEHSRDQRIRFLKEKYGHDSFLDGTRHTNSSFFSAESKASLRKMGCFRTRELMRATPASSVLRRFGRILAQSGGSEATYQLSMPAEAIDWFISHNWVTPWGAKYLAIAFFFNAHFAVFVAYVFMIAACLLTASGSLPMLSYEEGKSRGLYCTLGGPLVFLLVFTFASDISAACCPLRAQTRVFLDKVCVNQVDPVLKQQGIESLGAFLRNSKGMLIIYTDMYLQKLWTVYEVASVLILNPDMRVCVVPTAQPKMFMCFMAVLLGILCSAQAFRFDGLFGGHRHIARACTVALCLPFTIVAMAAAHGWNKDKDQIDTSLSSFHMRDAKCFCEDDRPMVQGNVADCLRELEVVAPEATDDEALLVFDTMVQAELPQLIATHFGHLGVRYDNILVVVIPCLGWALDALGSMIYDQDANAGQIAFAATRDLVVVFSVWPNIIALLMMTAKCSSKVEGGHEMLVLVLAGTWVWLAGIAFMFILELSSGSSWAQPAYLMVHFIVTFLAYRPSLHRHRFRQGAKRLHASVFAKGFSFDSLTLTPERSEPLEKIDEPPAAERYPYESDMFAACTSDSSRFIDTTGTTATASSTVMAI